ncbi:MAG TPA: NAD(P)-dependent oxidoreductase [Xanthobacteraceae bacterium]|nr:NAD(P)-dependent oxidoreductase [Xanthobacteraceae bacterium]
MRIFLAGATGVIGRPLVRLLAAAGHEVTGTTRSAAKADALVQAGAKAAVVDVFDGEALKAAVVATRPEVVIHQLTDLPDSSNADAIAASLAANARIRIEGTENLIAAAKAAGARRMIAQSISFIYAPGREPHVEEDPLVPPDTISARGVHALESAVTGTPGLEGIVLRYGRLYGPGTWAEKPTGRGFLHVDAAAQAALLALTRGGAGIYNIAEDDGEVSIAKARRELGFDPAFRAGS